MVPPRLPQKLLERPPSGRLKTRVDSGIRRGRRDEGRHSPRRPIHNLLEEIKIDGALFFHRVEGEETDPVPAVVSPSQRCRRTEVLKVGSVCAVAVAAFSLLPPIGT